MIKARELTTAEYGNLLNTADSIEDNIVVAYGRLCVEVMYVNEAVTVLSLHSMSEYVANMIYEGVETVLVKATLIERPLDEREATMLATNMIFDYAEEQQRAADANIH